MAACRNYRMGEALSRLMSGRRSAGRAIAFAAACSRLAVSQDAGAKLRSGLEDLKTIGKADPAQIIIAYNVECLPK